MSFVGVWVAPHAWGTASHGLRQIFSSPPSRPLPLVDSLPPPGVCSGAGYRAPVCSVALLLNLVLYTLSILVIAPVTIALYPGVFLGFSLPARCFIAIGAIMQLALAGLFLLLLVRPGLVERVAGWG